MPLTRRQQARLASRLTELCREVRTLRLAFAPLGDFQQEHFDARGLLSFVLLAMVLLAYSVVRELRGVR